MTQFELLTAAAFVAFAAAKVEVGVIEAGLGGRLDATNVIASRATVLTSVGLDHTEYLGETIEEIAAEKLAVLRDRSVLIHGELPAEAEAVAEREAAAHHARTLVAGEAPGAFAEGMPLLPAPQPRARARRGAGDRGGAARAGGRGRGRLAARPRAGAAAAGRSAGDPRRGPQRRWRPRPGRGPARAAGPGRPAVCSSPCSRARTRRRSPQRSPRTARGSSAPRFRSRRSRPAAGPAGARSPRRG